MGIKWEKEIASWMREDDSWPTKTSFDSLWRRSAELVRASIEADVDVVEYGTAHGHGEVELIHGGCVGGHHRRHVLPFDANGH